MNFYTSKHYHKKFPYVLYVHEKKHEKGFVHDQDFYEVFLTYSDSVQWNYGKEKIVLPCGTLVFVSPGEPHWISVSEGFEYKYVNLSFSGEEYLRALDFLGYRGYRNSLENKIKTVTLTSDEKEKWLALLKKIKSSDFDSETRRLAYARTVLVRIFSELLCDEGKIDNAPSWLNVFLHWLRSDHNFALGFDEICEHSGKTKQYLCSVMKKYAGTTPTAYINDLRLGYIASMLESSKTPISELCFEAGFYSESYFEKLFKEKYKITPGEYRKRNKLI